MPSRSNTGSRSSTDCQKRASLAAAASGRPLSSEFIREQAELGGDRDRALPVARGRLAIGFVRSGPAEEQQDRDDLDARGRQGLRKERTPEAPTRGWVKNGMKSGRGESSMT